MLDYLDSTRGIRRETETGLTTPRRMHDRPHGWSRPQLPSDEELAPEYVLPPPPTLFESLCLCIHSNHRLYTVVMFALCVTILLWGGINGINVRSMSNATSAA